MSRYIEILLYNDIIEKTRKGYIYIIVNTFYYNGELYLYYFFLSISYFLYYYCIGTQTHPPTHPHTHTYTQVFPVVSSLKPDYRQSH